MTRGALALLGGAAAQAGPDCPTTMHENRYYIQSRPDAVPAGSAKVSIDDHAFRPTEMIVRLGTEVTWVNYDQAPHTVTGNRFHSSDRMNTGEAYTMRFERVGTFDYHCSIHPHMTGRVIVQP
jgi:plastocyanin